MRQHQVSRLVMLTACVLPALWWYFSGKPVALDIKPDGSDYEHVASSLNSHRPPQFDSPDAHNAYVEYMLTRCKAQGLLHDTADPLPSSPRRAGIAVEDDDCGGNQTTIVVLASQWFQAAYIHRTAQYRHPTGEMIYAGSFLRTLDRWGYSYIFTGRHRGDSGMKRMMDVYARWEGNVRMVVADQAQVEECWNSDWCAKQEGGIPVWRLFTFWYWDSPANPLGPKWTLSPSPRSNNTLLSYSIEPSCRETIARLKRPVKPTQAYLLAKSGSYLDPPHFPWSLPALSSIRKSLKIRMISAMHVEDQVQRDQLSKAGIENLGKLEKSAFHGELAESFVLIGVGLPKLSPSPWEALCLGTPFINPILKWDRNHPEDRTRWITQNDWMLDLDHPYVYHVHAHDLAALSNAVKSAMSRPIGSFVPAHMTWKAVCDYTADLLEKDWRAEAQLLEDDRDI